MIARLSGDSIPRSAAGIERAKEMKIDPSRSKVLRTPDEVREHEAIHQHFLRVRPSLEELIKSGDVSEPMPMGEFLNHRQAIRALRDIRTRKRMSLAEVAKRSRMDKGAISRLESGQHANPTVATVARYAAAIGARIVWNISAPGTFPEPERQERQERRSVKMTSAPRKRRR
jgi:DNA-binding phage protein